MSKDGQRCTGGGCNLRKTERLAGRGTAFAPVSGGGRLTPRCSTVLFGEEEAAGGGLERTASANDKPGRAKERVAEARRPLTTGEGREGGPCCTEGFGLALETNFQD